MNKLTKEEKRILKKDIGLLLKKASVNTNSLDFVKVEFDDDNFELIGCGCSSGVFRHKRFRNVAVKVYSPEHRKEARLETLAYKRVSDLDCFPKLYMYGKDFLAIEFIEGRSLYDCIIEGIEIPDGAVEKVDKAILQAKARGLVPSDVHFKNIVLNGDKVTMIDLSDYLTAKHVTRWERLKFFYKTVYRPFLKGVRIPKPVVDLFRKLFKRIEKYVLKLLAKS